MNCNLNGSPISGFSALLYVNFIIKKKYRVDAIAKEMRIATDTLYRYIRGENIIPPDRIIDLIKATKDVEYLDFFCEPVGYIAIPAPRKEITPQERIQDEIELSILNGLTLEAIERAYKDGHITKIEYQKIHQLLTRLQQKAAELKEKIKREVL
jgi:hypothetical protein